MLKLLKHSISRAAALILLVSAPLSVCAEALLRDVNGDGAVNILAFGDSITQGEGDGFSPGEYVEGTPAIGPGYGYPARVEVWLGVPVDNEGLAGEDLERLGIERLGGVLQGSNADIVLLKEGINDAYLHPTRGQYRREMQRAINMVRATGKEVVVGTLAPPCCGYAELADFGHLFSSVVRELASINEVPVADIEKTWNTSCEDRAACEFYNLPEGLHPNTLGYDAIAQTFTAVLLGINIFSAEGASALESALGWPAGSVIVKPEAAVP